MNSFYYIVLYGKKVPLFNVLFKFGLRTSRRLYPIQRCCHLTESW